MRERSITITTRQLELRQTEQGIFGLRRQWVIHYEMLVITFCIRCVRSERRPPEQRLRV
jgi:hypothetical protein